MQPWQRWGAPVLLVLCAVAARAEHVTVSGCAIDSLGNPRPGINIQLDGEYDGLAMLNDAGDDQGRFKVDVPKGSPARPVTTRLRAHVFWQNAGGPSGSSDWVTVTNRGAPVDLGKCLVVPGWQWVKVTVHAPEWKIGGECNSAICPMPYFRLRLTCIDVRCSSEGPSSPINAETRMFDFNERLPEGQPWSIEIVEQPADGTYACYVLNASNGVLTPNRDAENRQHNRNLADIECRLTAAGKDYRARRIEEKAKADAAYTQQLEQQNKPPPPPPLALPRRAGGDGTQAVGASVAQDKENKDNPAAAAERERLAAEQKQQAYAELDKAAGQYAGMVVGQVAAAVAAPAPSRPPAATPAMAPAAANGPCIADPNLCEDIRLGLPPGTTQGMSSSAPTSMGAVGASAPSAPRQMPSTGTPANSYTQNLPSRVIAGDGRLATDCVRLEDVASGDSSVSGGGRVLANHCGDVVEVTWCYADQDCNIHGNRQNLGVGASWPVSAIRDIRWGACHGADTASFEEGSHGLRTICTAPLR